MRRARAADGAAGAAAGELDAAPGRRRRLWRTREREPEPDHPPSRGRRRGGDHEIEMHHVVATHELPARVTALPRDRLRARSRYLPSEVVVAILLLLVAATAAALLVLGILRVAVTG